MSAKILIGADIVPTEKNMGLFVKGDVEQLLGAELKKYMDSADYIILNLEAPFTDKETPIIKAGENFRIPTKAFEGVKNINPYFLGLANNHILDQEEKGLDSTIHLLKANKIAYAGAGKNLAEASKPYIADINGYKIGIYVCAEHEYSIAEDNKAGANPYDPLYSFDHIRNLKGNCDYVIVLYHGGKEYYRYPTPMLQRTFHKFAEVGADLVIAQHTHCIGCYEKYMSSTLVYGQGNFLFDDSDREEEKTSLLLEVSLTDGGNEIKFVPLVKYISYVRMANDELRNEILKGFEDRSEKIIRPGFILKEFETLAQNQRRNYLLGLAGGFSRILPIRVICKLFGEKATDHYYHGKKSLPADDFIKCETHREMMLEILKNRIIDNRKS